MNDNAWSKFNARRHGLVGRAEDELKRIAAASKLLADRAGEIGTTVCFMGDGIAPEGPAGLFRRDGTIRIIGFTEHATKSRLQVRVNRIEFLSHGRPPEVSLDRTTLGVADIRQGDVAWFDRGGWLACD